MSYVRVSIKGSSIGTEVWSINPCFDPTGEFPGGVDQTALDAATLAIASIAPGTNLRALLSNVASRTGAQVEVRDDVTDELIALSQVSSPSLATGTTTIAMAPQNAIVLSLRTSTPGASGRGRLFWPAMGAGIDSQGRLSSPSVALFLSDMKTYLAAIEAALETAFPTISFNLAVRSKTTKTTPHVNRIQAGTLIDTQRRRRDSLPESYSALSYP